MHIQLIEEAELYNRCNYCAVVYLPVLVCVVLTLCHDKVALQLKVKVH